MGSHEFVRQLAGDGNVIDDTEFFGSYFPQVRTDVPRIIEILNYWRRIRGEKTMPRRRDFDPIDVPRHLPGITLVDVLNQDPNGCSRFRYRVVGDWEIHNRGRNPTGLFIEEGFFSTSADRAVRDYLKVCERQTPVFYPRDFVSEQGIPINEFCLFLPFSEDGNTVSQVLVYSERRQKFLPDLDRFRVSTH